MATENHQEAAILDMPLELADFKRVNIDRLCLKQKKLLLTSFTNYYLVIRFSSFFSSSSIRCFIKMKNVGLSKWFGGLLPSFLGMF